MTIGFVAAFILTCLITCSLLGLALASCHLPKDDELIAMFHEKGAEIEQLRAMYENDTAPRFTVSDFLDYKFHEAEFGGQFVAQALLEALAEHGISVQAKPWRRGVEGKLTPRQALNFILSDSRDLDQKLKNISLPKEADKLLRDKTRLSYRERVKLNRLILQTAFPDKCPKKLGAEEASRRILGGIVARGITVPNAPTAMESLNKLLSGDSLYNRFSNIPLPKDAEGLVSRASSLNKIERIKLNRLILQAAFPNECPKPGEKLWAVYDTSDFECWLGVSLAHRPKELDLVGVSNERIKEYQRLLRQSGFRGIDGSPRATRITVYVEGLSIGPTTHKGYSHPYKPPEKKFLVQGLDYEKPPQKPDTFYSPIEAGWYLYRTDD